MKTLILTLTLAAVSAGAQTNLTIQDTSKVALTNAVEDKTLYDITLGAGGTIVKNSSGQSLDFSLSANPFKSCRALWLGYSQGLAWKPFTGSSDLDVEWQIPVYRDKGYLLPAWSGGCVYGGGTSWRTGPELIGQYYTSDHSFLIAQANYDLATKGSGAVRWFLGIGMEF